MFCLFLNFSEVRLGERFRARAQEGEQKGDSANEVQGHQEVVKGRVIVSFIGSF